MIRLTNAVIHKYKCIEQEQTFVVEDGITVLVGMNESGKTSILEALAKSNYFENDANYKFNSTYDYPRRQKKAMDKSGEIPYAVTLKYEIDDSLKHKIELDLGVSLLANEFEFTRKYNNDRVWKVTFVDKEEFINCRANKIGIDKENIDLMIRINSEKEFDDFIEQYDVNDENLDVVKNLKKYFINRNNWENCIDEYVTTNYLVNNLPKFMYYDDYYMLPSRVSLDNISDDIKDSNSHKTVKALLELADIDVNILVHSTNYEEFIAELEATQINITDELFKYWTTNKNLKILFKIDKIENIDNRSNKTIVEHVLDIRVQNQRSGVSLPLANRSKGFNWFFSFLVWFMKIQEDRNNTYILLLDEPGLNLHAKAQNDLLKFLSDLSQNYQIIYTTHSPFMIETEKLNTIRTVLEKKDGTHISDSVQEKDPNTIFPLQAALGYNLAQNLFVSKRNLLVEGISDLTYLTIMSSMLEANNRVGLNENIIIVPTGGVDKVATFVSLLRGNELNMVCLLDTFTDQYAQARLKNLVAQNIIKENKIIFYHDILGKNFADIEDLFSIDEYLKIYNGALKKNISINEISSEQPILHQLKKINNNKDFNHYSPANYLARNIADISFSECTLNNFELLFQKVNNIFD